MVLSILRKAAKKFGNFHQSFHFDGPGLTLLGLYHDCGSTNFVGLDCKDFLFCFLKIRYCSVFMPFFVLFALHSKSSFCF